MNFSFKIKNPKHKFRVFFFSGEFIGRRFRILNKDINILVGNNEIESQEYVKNIEERIKKIPFDNIDTKFSNYRYILLDNKHNYENSRRTTEWKKGTESIFSTITDEIIAKLTDTAPDLTDKLWSISNTFSQAQTGENMYKQ